MFSDTISSRFDGIFTEIPKATPTQGEPDGPLTGNGDIGLTFGVQDGLLKGFIGKNDIWCASPNQFGGGVKSVAAFALSLGCGIDGAAFSAHEALTTADLEVKLTTDECTIRIDSYVPYEENAVVIKLTCEKGNTFVRADLYAQDFDKCRITRKTTGTHAHISKAYDRDEYTFKTYCDADMTRVDGGKLCFDVNEGDTATFVITVFTNYDDQSLRTKKIDLEKARAAHLAFWKSFWSKSHISIPSEPNIERFWYGSQYIMACSAKKDRFAPGIFGPFITSEQANWGSDFHLNYNYEAAWWGVFSSNHVELAEPYDKPLFEYMPKSRQNARELLGCRGIYSIVGIGPMGHESEAMFRKDGTQERQTPFWGQKTNAAYAAVNMIMRFYSTYDTDYVREKAYPYCKEVADFWEDYLKWDGKRYVVENDCIHENGYLAGRHEPWKNTTIDYSDDCNSLLSLGLVRMLMRGLLQMSEFLGEDENRREKWQHILDNLSEYPTQIRNGKKVFRYTEKGMDWCGGNSLGIQHIYPARGIGLSSDPELLQIARDTVVEMARWEDYNAFPTFFTAACFLGYDPDDLLKKLNRELRVHGFDNLFVYYGGGGLECASTVPSTVNNMFMQSHEDYIRIFPVWNKNTDASFENLRADGAFVVSGGVKDGIISSVTVVSERGRTLKVICPWKNGMKILCAEKQLDYGIEHVKDGDVYSVETQPGLTYILSEA